MYQYGTLRLVLLVQLLGYNLSLSWQHVLNRNVYKPYAANYTIKLYTNV